MSGRRDTRKKKLKFNFNAGRRKEKKRKKLGKGLVLVSTTRHLVRHAAVLLMAQQHTK